MPISALVGFPSSRRRVRAGLLVLGLAAAGLLPHPAASQTSPAKRRLHRIAPAVTVKPSSFTIASAKALIVTVRVKGGSGEPPPTGAVTLSSPGSSPAARTLSGGSAAFSVAGGSLEAFECYSATGLPAPQDILLAGFDPDAASASTYRPASGQTSVTVVGACTALTPGLLAITWEQAQLQATPFSIQASSAPGLPVPTGTVTLTTGNATSPPAMLSNGTATVSIPAGTFTTGSNVIYSNYAGDANYLPRPMSASALVSVGGVTVTVMPSAQRISATQSLTVTVRVNAGRGSPEPTGMLALISGSYMSDAMPLTNGRAAITIPGGTLPPGNDTIEADYEGGNYAGASGSAQVTVNLRH
jgi:hypothetical protein